MAPFISSTRSITIHASPAQVWAWLIQLGADRGGFYSYWFIEKPMGYQYRSRNWTQPEFKDMEVGRIIRSSLDPSRSVIEYNFPVVAVDPGRSIVLKNWGSFLLRKTGPNHTRLIVRTHGKPLTNPVDHLEYFFMMPLHYIMERRMLMGIKARSETGPGAPLSSIEDMIWFAGISFSLLSIIALPFIDTNTRRQWLSIPCSTLWLLTFFVFDPIPTYSLSLLLTFLAYFAWYFRKQRIQTIF